MNFKRGIEIPWCKWLRRHGHYQCNHDWKIDHLFDAKDRDIYLTPTYSMKHTVCYLSDKRIFSSQNISHLKFKVQELSTGKTKVEEWTFLPANWDHDLFGTAILDKNFVFLDFHTWGNLSTDTDDILIMNLVTRTKFWMRSGTLMAQVKEKAADRLNFGYFLPYASEMNVEKDRIVIKYKIRLETIRTLGWFSNPYMYICYVHRWYSKSKTT